MDPHQKELQKLAIQRERLQIQLLEQELAQKREIVAVSQPMVREQLQLKALEQEIEQKAAAHAAKMQREKDVSRI